MLSFGCDDGGLRWRGSFVVSEGVASGGHDGAVNRHRVRIEIRLAIGRACKRAPEGRTGCESPLVLHDFCANDSKDLTTDFRRGDDLTVLVHDGAPGWHDTAPSALSGEGRLGSLKEWIRTKVEFGCASRS